MGSSVKKSERDAAVKHFIYVIQMHTASFPSRFVKLMTGYKYSHVVIAVEKECKTTYSFGRKSLNNILDGGFVVEEKNAPFFRKYNKTVCCIYEIEVSEKQYDLVCKLLDEKKKLRDIYKYDFFGTALRFFGIPARFKNRAVCSQFVAEVLEECDIIHFDKPSYFIRPKDFENLCNFKKVYEGSYRLYNDE